MDLAFRHYLWCKPNRRWNSRGGKMSGGASAKKGGVSSYAYPFTEPANIPPPQKIWKGLPQGVE